MKTIELLNEENEQLKDIAIERCKWAAKQENIAKVLADRLEAALAENKRLNEKYDFQVLVKRVASLETKLAKAVKQRNEYILGYDRVLDSLTESLIKRADEELEKC